MTDEAVNTINSQFVSTNGDTIGVTFPATVMTKEQALVHAAWLVSLSDPLGERFAEVLKAVQNT